MMKYVDQKPWGKVEVEAPTICKVTEQGATVYFIIMKLIFCQ